MYGAMGITAAVSGRFSSHHLYRAQKRTTSQSPCNAIKMQMQISCNTNACCNHKLDDSVRLRLSAMLLSKGQAELGELMITLLGGRLMGTLLSSQEEYCMHQDTVVHCWARRTIRAVGLRSTISRMATATLRYDYSAPLRNPELSARLTEHEIDNATINSNLKDEWRTK